MSAVSFQRLYLERAGLEHEASPRKVEAVLRSMTESLGGPNPFRVRLRMEDGSAVVVKPKGWMA